MSWDILIMDLPHDAASLADVPDGFQPDPLGSRDEVITAILDVAPSADFGDPEWGYLDSEAFSIEFSMHGDEVVETIMLHVRGGGSVVDFIATLLTRLGCRAVDCAESEFFSPETSGESLRAWQAYRDSVVDRS